MSNVSGYEDVYTPQGVKTGESPDTPNEQRDDYLVRVSRKNIRTLESQASKAEAAEERAAAAERKAAFALAGIDVTSDAGGLFARGYEGDLEPEKIRAAAQQFNLVKPAENNGGEGEKNGTEGENKPTDAKLEDGEEKLHDEQNNLANNSPGDRPVAGDPYKDAAEVYTTVMNGGGQEKEGLGAYLNSVVNAAHQGDARVILATRNNAE